jgi:hypothetical protein
MPNASSTAFGSPWYNGSTHQQLAGDLASHCHDLIFTKPGPHQIGDEQLQPIGRTRIAVGRGLPTSLEPSSLTVGEAGDLQGPQGIRLRPRALAGRGLSFECGCGAHDQPTNAALAA